jgi:hypothetical protein
MSAEAPYVDKWSRWTQLASVSLPILAAAIYALLRTSYIQVYEQFGLTPEDVGLGRIEILTNSVRVFRLYQVALIVFLFISLAILANILNAHFDIYSVNFMEELRTVFVRSKSPRGLSIPSPRVWKLWQVRELDDEALKRLSRGLSSGSLKRQAYFNFLQDVRKDLIGRTRSVTGRWVSLRGLLIVLGFLLLAFLVALLIALPSDIEEATRRIQKGESIGSSELQFLDIRAYQAKVYWIGDGEPPKNFPASQLLYLGHDSKAAVLYDHINRATWRISEDKAIIRINP